MLPINEEDVSRFIEIELPNLLRKDIERHYILKEDDLQYRVYFHIQSYFEKYENFIWRTLSRPYLSHVRKYPDLVLIENMKPRHVIELKDLIDRNVGLEEIKRDINKIGDIIKKYNTIFKGYFIFVSNLEPSDYENLTKEIKFILNDKDLIIIISLNLKDILLEKNIVEWEKEREKYGGL